MILKSRLYYVLFVVAITMIVLSVVILLIAPPMSDTVTIAEIGIPLSELPPEAAEQPPEAAEQPPEAAEQPDAVANPGMVPESDASVLESRTLVFYPPGTAPSEELEFEPVPFNELLPSSDVGPMPLDSTES